MSRAYPCARQRRLRLPLHVEPLLERHQVLELMYDLATAVAVARPEDPLPFFRDFLCASQNIKFCPRIMLVPSEDVSRSFADVGALMANMAGLELLTREDLIWAGVLSNYSISRSKGEEEEEEQAEEEEQKVEAEAEAEAEAEVEADVEAERRTVVGSLLVEGPVQEAVEVAERSAALGTLLVEGPVQEAVAVVAAARSTVRRAIDTALGVEAAGAEVSSTSSSSTSDAAAAVEAAEAAAGAATRCWGCARERAGAAAGRLLAPRTQALGWLLADAPACRAEAEAMRRAGVLPTHLMQMRELLCPRHYEAPPEDGKAAAVAAAAVETMLTTSVEWAAACSRASCLGPQVHTLALAQERMQKQAAAVAGAEAEAEVQAEVEEEAEAEAEAEVEVEAKAKAVAEAVAGTRSPKCTFRHERGERQGPLLDEASGDVDAVLSVFRHTPLIRVVEVRGGDHEHMAAAALGQAFARRQPRGHAWLPRIALFGPECAGLRWHLQRLSYQFGLCPVDFLTLLREEPRPPQTSVERLSWSLPAARAAQLVAQRVAQQDCLLSGWALVGFPRDAADLAHLDRTAFPPNRVFLFNNSTEWCLRHALGGALVREARAGASARGRAEPGVQEMLAAARRLGARGEAALRDSVGYSRRLAALRALCAGTATVVDGERGRALVYHQLRAALAQAAPPVPPRACSHRAGGRVRAHFPAALPHLRSPTSPRSAQGAPATPHAVSSVPSAASVRSRLMGAAPTAEEHSSEESGEDALEASLALQ